MGSLYTQTMSGMTKSDIAVDMIARAPLFGYKNTTIPKVHAKNRTWLSTTRIDDLNSDPMRITTINTASGGARGVLPCKGLAAPGMSPGGPYHVLRRPAVNQMGGYYPHPIPGVRAVKKGLLEQPQYRTHKLMPIADSFNAGMNSTLGQPA